MTVWSEKAIEDLTRLWADGYSASAIASEMGWLTRSAVLGKVHRLGLPARAPRMNARAKEERPVPKRARRLPRPPSEKVTIIRPRFQMAILKRLPEMTKSQLRAELAQAVRNTAAMPVE